MLPPASLPLDQLQETPWCVEYRRSSQGLRDRLYSAQPARGQLRIVGMGDSFAFGEGVPVEKSLFKQMEQLLGAGVEIVNGAQVGIPLGTEVKLLKRMVPELHCERAIVVVIANDIDQSVTLRNQQSYINDLINVRDTYLAAHEERRWYAGSLRVLEVIGSYFERRRIAQDTIEWYRDLYSEEKNGENLEKMGRDFAQIARLPGCQAAVVIYPLMQKLGEDYPLRDVHKTIARLAQSAGLPTLDLEPTFRGRDTEAMQVHPTDHHPNGKAHAIAAQAILEWLRREQPGFLPPR